MGRPKSTSSSSVRRVLDEQRIQSSLPSHSMSLSVIFFWGNMRFGGSVNQWEEQNRAGGKRLMPELAQRETPGDEGRANPWVNRPGAGTLQGLRVIHWGFHLPFGFLHHHGQTLAAAKASLDSCLSWSRPSSPYILEEGSPWLQFLLFLM